MKKEIKIKCETLWDYGWVREALIIGLKKREREFEEHSGDGFDEDLTRNIKRILRESFNYHA